MRSLEGDALTGPRLAGLAALTAVTLTLVSVGWAACGRQPIAERLGLRPGRAGVGVQLLLAIGLLGLSFGLDQLINLLGLRPASHLAQYDTAVAGTPESDWPWLLLGLCVAPGIGEEIFFRGLLQRGLAPWLGRGGALFAAAAIFGAFHADVVHGTGAFFLGLYLGAVAVLTGGTRAAITCHLLNNLAAVLGVALPAQALPAPLVAVALGLASAGLALFGADRILRWGGASGGRLPLQGPSRPADP